MQGVLSTCPDILLAAATISSNFILRGLSGSQNSSNSIAYKIIFGES